MPFIDWFPAIWETGELDQLIWKATVSLVHKSLKLSLNLYTDFLFTLYKLDFQSSMTRSNRSMAHITATSNTSVHRIAKQQMILCHRITKQQMILCHRITKQQMILCHRITKQQMILCHRITKQQMILCNITKFTASLKWSLANKNWLENNCRCCMQQNILWIVIFFYCPFGVL
jgi:hypothetical protein